MGCTEVQGPQNVTTEHYGGAGEGGCRLDDSGNILSHRSRTYLGLLRQAVGKLQLVSMFDMPREITQDQGIR